LECEEAAVRVALDDATLLYRNAPEATVARESGALTVRAFMQEVLPTASEATRELAGALISTTLSAVGKQFSETLRVPAEIEAYADAMADMFCAYLKGLESGWDGRPTRRGGNLKRGEVIGHVDEALALNAFRRAPWSGVQLGGHLSLGLKARSVLWRFSLWVPDRSGSLWRSSWPVTDSDVV
jgi:Tetracyclin repressor-like, C-terminal domain